jgi:SlyX protein
MTPHDERVDERLIQLEIKLSYTEDLVDTLNDLVASQQMAIDRLLRELAELKHQRADESGPALRGLRDDLPPHY